MKYLLLMVLSIVTGVLPAQLDSIDMATIEFRPITILDSPTLKAQQQSYTQSLRRGYYTSDPIANVSRILEKSSTVYVKSYGLGSLATLTLRGGSASQTQLQWEGLPINNPMLGLSDLSLVPITLFDKVHLAKGGLSATEGSGAMTGLLNLTNQKPDIDYKYMSGIAAGIGQWGMRCIDGVLGFSQKSLSVKAKIFSQSADNNYSYIIGSNIEKQNLNAQYKTSGFLVDTDIKLPHNHLLRFNIWYQNTNRGIPPTTVQNRSEATQDDILRRIKGSWSKTFSNIYSTATVAYFDEENNYRDPERLTIAENRFKKFLQFSSAQWRGSKTSYTLSYEYSQLTGQSKSYVNSSNDRRTFSVINTIAYKPQIIHVTGSLRKEWNNLTAPPLIPSLTLELPSTHTLISLKLSREFRSPTLNELYWIPGGNLELLPEEGWNQELSVNYRSKKKKNTPNQFNINTTIHHRKINNWIVWTPRNGSSLWTPTNLAAVRSYGLDTNVDKSLQWKNKSLTFKSGYAYTKSCHIFSVPDQGINAGDQLIYTPDHKAHINFIGQINNTSLSLNIQHTSQVVGINENLDAFTTMDLNLAYNNTANLGSTITESTFQFTINNLLNTEYRVIERRVMPPRYFTFNWTITLKK